jgi:hypothetical protein
LQTYNICPIVIGILGQQIFFGIEVVLELHARYANSPMYICLTDDAIWLLKASRTCETIMSVMPCILYRKKPSVIKFFFSCLKETGSR